MTLVSELAGELDSSTVTTQAELIARLELIPHPEGGYFRETYRDGAPPMASRGRTDERGEQLNAGGDRMRNRMTSIYWMPTRTSPIGWLCCNQSAHVHYYHAGASLRYHLLSPQGQLSKANLGPDLAGGDVMQLIVPGGYWKAVELTAGDFSLIGEAVCPGFDFDDFRFITTAELNARGQQYASLARCVRPEPALEFEQYYESQGSA